MTFDSYEMGRLRDLIHDRTGLWFEERKFAFLQARVLRCMKEVGAETLRDYFRLLRYGDPGGDKFQRLVETLTVNETYFFREYPQLQAFANEALPQIADRKRDQQDYRLSVWCAACSTGEEAYTLAIILDACLDDASRWSIRLLATDIDTRALEAAQRGVYGDRAVKDVPEVYYRKYFVYRDGHHCICDSIKHKVTFRQVNLFDRQVMRRQRGFDFIFCRNVLIYFNDVSRKQVLADFYDALLPGGFIFLGHSESVGRISAAFSPVRLGKTIGYRRPFSLNPNPCSHREQRTDVKESLLCSVS